MRSSALTRGKCHGAFETEDLVAAATLPAVATAQTETFESLQNELRVNERLSVTDDAGREIPGRPVEVTSSSLTLQVSRTAAAARGRQVFRRPSVAKVGRWRPGLAPQLLVSVRRCVFDASCRGLSFRDGRCSRIVQFFANGVFSAAALLLPENLLLHLFSKFAKPFGRSGHSHRIVCSSGAGQRR